MKNKQDIYKLLNRLARLKRKEAFLFEEMAFSIEHYYKNLTFKEIKEKILIPFLDKLDERGRINENE